MNMKMRGVLLVLTVLALPAVLSAQYWGERVLEKGFEQTDFFFTPSNLMPFGIGSFKGSTAGLVNDPLQEMIVNPSRLTLDSTKDVWLYTDFRGAKNVKKEENNWIMPAYAYDVRYASSLYSMPYPRVYLDTRRELEPVFSGAIIFRPLPEMIPGFHVGGTYQYLLQDAKYYDVPQDIYRTAAGYDFNGRTVAASSSMPILDVSSGKDDMHQTGHFGSVFLRYAIDRVWDVGFKASRALFQRNGSLGSSTYWDYSSNSPSLWGNMEKRTQSHATWDLGGGITCHISDRVSLGISAGNLWGDAVQARSSTDTSYTDNNSGTWTSYYNRSSNALSQWNHRGATSYYGGDILARTSPTATLNFFYRHQRSTIDIGLGSGILDTSYSTYTNTYNGQSYNSMSQSFLSDNRSGGGAQNITTDRLAGSVRWQIDDRVSLSVGAQLEWYRMEIKTSESVLLANRYGYFSSPGGYQGRSAQDESKDLLWTFTSKRTSLQIPVFLTIQASRSVQLIFGLNRDMASWNIDEVTLALFRYRITEQNGVVTQKTNFGERYTVPNENESDIRTTFLAGLAVSPSEKLNLRLLMVPNFREGIDGQELDQLQLWLGVTLTP